MALRIYKTKILPYIDYGDIFYMSTTNEVLDKLDKLQYRALRICLGTTYRTPRVELIQRTQIPLLKYRRMAHLRNVMYKRSWDQQYIVSIVTTHSFSLVPLQPTLVLVCLGLGLGMSSLIYATGHIKDPVPLIEKRRGLSPGGRFPPSFIHQVIIITGLNKLYNCMFSP